MRNSEPDSTSAALRRRKVPDDLNTTSNGKFAAIIDDGGSEDENGAQLHEQDTIKGSRRAGRSQSAASSASVEAEVQLAKVDDDAPPRAPAGLQNLAALVELYEVQLLMVMLIVMDLLLSTADLLWLGGAGGRSGALVEHQGAWVAVAQRVSGSLMDFTIFFFALELLVLLAAFRSKFLLHLGYMLDLAIVAACLWRELQGGSKELRLLGYCRGWRVVRLVNTLVEQAQERASRAADREAEAQRRAIEVEADRRRLAEALRLEREARKNTETMLLGYKEEAETLREALNIAAMDIAEAAASDLEGDGSDGSASDDSGPMHEGKRRGTASKADRPGDDRGDRIFVSEDGSWTSR